MPDVLGKINGVIGLAKKAIDIADSMRNLELKQLIVDITEQLVDARADVIEKKDELLTLKEENSQLKAELKALAQPPTLVRQDKLYYKQNELDAGEQIPYCPLCWELHKKEMTLQPSNSTVRKLHRKQWSCPNCGNYF